MSRLQGDYFKTHTDHALNAYKFRLDAKLLKLIDKKEKWYRAGKGWILTEERNRMFNPNGHWKWNGWQVQAREYWITVFPEECVEIRDGRPVATGWSQIRHVIDDDKAAANRFFNEVAVKVARNLETWIPEEYNNRVWFDYEGRKQKAVITFHWDGDTYFYTLDVDGEKVLNAYDREECVREAERIGAELIETHTP